MVENYPAFARNAASMENPRLQRLSVTMGAVREMIARDLRASADGRPASGRTLAMALELLEVLWSELRQMSDEHDRLRVGKSS